MAEEALDGQADCKECHLMFAFAEVGEVKLGILFQPQGIPPKSSPIFLHGRK